MIQVLFLFLAFFAYAREPPFELVAKIFLLHTADLLGAQTNADEFREQRMRIKRAGDIFRVELRADEKRMVGHFHRFHDLSIRRQAGDFQAAVGQQIAVAVIELIAMPVPFGNDLVFFAEAAISGGQMRAFY